MRTGFRYGFDPLCLVACLLYLANSVWLAGGGGGHIARAYFNDFLMIPCALPLVLWVHAILGWREKSAYPNLWEILGHVLVWSVVAEAIGPRLVSGTVADFRDVLAYAGGAFVAGLWWQTDWNRELSLGTVRIRT